MQAHLSTFYSIGADERNRTVDLLITNELLYQLSYIGLAKDYINKVFYRVCA